MRGLFSTLNPHRNSVNNAMHYSERVKVSPLARHPKQNKITYSKNYFYVWFKKVS